MRWRGRCIAVRLSRPVRRLTHTPHRELRSEDTGVSAAMPFDVRSDGCQNAASALSLSLCLSLWKWIRRSVSLAAIRMER